MTNDNVPFKYLLSMWKTMPNYPTKLDVLYELYSHIVKNMKNSEFSEQTFNAIWYDQSGVANWKGTAIESKLNEMFADGTFVKSRDVGEKSWYKIADAANPFL